MRAMRAVTVNGVRIDDTFAEAFPMRATGVVITADSAQWARQAAITMTGFATSVIGCGCEAGIDRELKPAETPDGRPGVRVLLFAVSTAELQKQLGGRVGQCVLTSPGSACYAGLDGAEIDPQRAHFRRQRANGLFRPQRGMFAKQSRDVDRRTGLMSFERYSADLHGFSVH